MKGNRGGRPSKPTALLKLRGTYQPVRHDQRKRNPVANGELASYPCPDWFTDDQRMLWADTLADVPPDLMKRIDADAFATYIQTRDRYIKAILAQRKLDEGQAIPFLVKGVDGPVVSPLISVIDRCIERMLRYQVEFGFTPSSRCRIFLPDSAPTINDANSGWGRLTKLRELANDGND